MYRRNTKYKIRIRWSTIARVLLFVVLMTPGIFAQDSWTNPIVKQGRMGSPLVETSPFVFKDQLYVLENNQRFWDVKGAKPGDHFHDDEIRIREVKSGKLVSVPLKNHGFGTVLVHNNQVYVFAGSYGDGKPWRRMTEITMTSSSDLKNWTKPVTVLKAHEKEHFFNTAVCRGKDKFVLLYETDDPRWKAFTFRYVESDDLVHWKGIPEAIYGKEKYVGGPALYYEGGWYYTLYLEDLKKGYETRITRSKDLVTWEDAPANRPFVTFDPSIRNIPLLDPGVPESNASDVELCYYGGQTILYFTGSDQTTAGDLQWATYKGTPKQLFEHFFIKPTAAEKPPKHEGNWTPVLIAPDQQSSAGGRNPSIDEDVPSRQQLEFQQRQLGAFIHFGPATYVASNMMTVPKADVFNPTRLDAEQWVKTAASFGAKHVVLTAKHHNGFCLWPTKTTDYSVKSSPWKDGKGDVVAEFVAACRKYGVKPGLYISGGDKNENCTSTPDPMGKRKVVGDVDAYFPKFITQLQELLSNYGEIDYIWFDGAYDPFGWDVMNAKTMERNGSGYGDAIKTMVRSLQPQAVVFGGTRPDVRWSGSEQGWASYPLWNSVGKETWADNWVGPENTGWLPAEANIHTRDRWFWYPDSDKTLRSVDFLTKVYLESIGRGANLLINMTPDTSGLIVPAETQRLADFGKQIETMFSREVKAMHSVSAEKETIVDLRGKTKLGWFEMEEDISKGQHISSYKLEAWTNGKWTPVATGSSVGRRRIQQLENLETDRLKFSVTSDKPDIPVKKLAVYGI
ncbi:alpha-L-fucosidase [Dyadobacter bucti]|uniref:alpha-L-fucosidase n=1 Tax=Dyadobacter bucti TaxID=2572203 RepID=UPI001108B72F|nr:alpha-L-fucosidase [Dyadobacter bucti]